MEWAVREQQVKSVLLIHRNRPERPSIEEQDKIFKLLNKDLDQIIL